MTTSTSFPSVGYLQSLERAGATEAADTPITPTPTSPLPNPFLMLKVQQAFASDPALKNAPIVIDVLDGVVHLAGIVRTRYQQTIAIYVAGEVEGVHAISNRIRIIPPGRKANSTSEANRNDVSPSPWKIGSGESGADPQLACRHGPNAVKGFRIAACTNTDRAGAFHGTNGTNGVRLDWSPKFSHSPADPGITSGTNGV